MCDRLKTILCKFNDQFEVHLTGWSVVRGAEQGATPTASTAKFEFGFGSSHLDPSFSIAPLLLKFWYETSCFAFMNG